MAALAMFDTYFYKYLGGIGIACGCNIYDPNFRVTLYTVLFIGSIVSAMICEIYMLVAKDFETALTSLFAWGIILQVSA